MKQAVYNKRKLKATMQESSERMNKTSKDIYQLMSEDKLSMYNKG